MELASLLLTVCALLTAEVLRRAWQYEHQSSELLIELNNEILHLREARKQAETLQRLSQAQTLAETVVDGGTATVRAVHKGIASIPFGILEAIPATSVSAKNVRKTHDAIADGVYNTISGMNRLLGVAARKAIKPTGSESNLKNPTPKPPPSD